MYIVWFVLEICVILFFTAYLLVNGYGWVTLLISGYWVISAIQRFLDTRRVKKYMQKAGLETNPVRPLHRLTKELHKDDFHNVQGLYSYQVQQFREVPGWEPIIEQYTELRPKFNHHSTGIRTGIVYADIILSTLLYFMLKDEFESARLLVVAYQDGHYQFASLHKNSGYEGMLAKLYQAAAEKQIPVYDDKKDEYQRVKKKKSFQLS